MLLNPFDLRQSFLPPVLILSEETVKKAKSELYAKRIKALEERKAAIEEAITELTAEISEE